MMVQNFRMITYETKSFNLVSSSGVVARIISTEQSSHLAALKAAITDKI